MLMITLNANDTNNIAIVLGVDRSWYCIIRSKFSLVMLRGIVGIIDYLKVK